MRDLRNKPRTNIKFWTLDKRKADLKVKLPQETLMLIGRSLASYFRYKTGREPRKMMINGVKMCSYPDWMKKHIDGSLLTCQNNPDTYNLYGMKKRKLLSNKAEESNKINSLRPVGEVALRQVDGDSKPKRKRVRIQKEPELITRSNKRQIRS